MKRFLILIMLSMLGCKSKSDKSLLFVGSYTDKELGEGIHVYEFNNETGDGFLKYVVDNMVNTSFLKISKDGNFLFSVVESQMKHQGKIAAFQVDPINSKIKLLNIQSCGGLNPAHLEIDKTGGYLFCSNYSDGSLSLFEIENNGSISEAKQVLQFKDSSVVKNRQEASHIHSSNVCPDNKYLYAQDLGADKIRRFDLDPNGRGGLRNEIEINLKPGSGPRHFTFHPKGKFGYSISELSGKITGFKYNGGDFEIIEDYLSYRKSLKIYSAADIHISQDGKFLYASNRGPFEDSISIFSINQEDGKLVLVGHVPTYGEHPRNFAIDPSGEYLLVANQFTNNIVIFKRDKKTGKLEKLPNEIKVNNPSSIQMYTYNLE